MSLLDYAQFGVAIFSIACLGYIVKLFIGFIKKQEDNFNEVIKNHIKHSTNAETNLEKSNTKMTAVLEQLIRYLERSNR